MTRNIITLLVAGIMVKHAVQDLESSFKLEFMMNSSNDCLLKPIRSKLEDLFGEDIDQGPQVSRIQYDVLFIFIFILLLRPYSIN
jgi:hypothetical protein